MGQQRPPDALMAVRTPERVSFGEGGAGTLVRPAVDARHPGVVVAPAIAGVNDYIVRVAGRLAARGYTCLIVDYFARRGGAPQITSRPQAMEEVARLSDPQVIADIRDAVAHLRESEADPERIGVLGFCVGGTYSLLAAAQLDGCSAAVAFYGLLRYRELTENKPLSPLDAVTDSLRCPLLGNFGELDELVPLDDVLELRERVSDASAEIYTYPGAGHGFHDDSRADHYRPVAAARAWSATLTHLDWYLRV